MESDKDVEGIAIAPVKRAGHVKVAWGRLGGKTLKEGGENESSELSESQDTEEFIEDEDAQVPEDLMNKEFVAKFGYQRCSLHFGK